ncbi:MAG TPA: phosphoenolpyruvate carboxykinase (ATP) [Myxococcales bacterium]|nr:phosphoenolpyruvate carboxykinase (ATP) [Myxococcales bacterium]HIN85389.1 phosphoenolpyruvate carboxykinase (ATP) [Myxococcales bacterium]
MILQDQGIIEAGEKLVGPYGIRPAANVHRNLSVEQLYQAGIERGQAQLLASGALHQETAPYFGRAAKSSFYVNNPDYRISGKSLDELMAWGNPETGAFDNMPISPAVYERLKARVVEHLSNDDDIYVFDGFSGRTPATLLNVRLVTTRAPSALFANNIFIRAKEGELDGFEAGWTILHAPDVEAEDADGTNGSAFIISDFVSKTTIIGGTRYHGQIKKSIFSVQNFRLPLKGILTMHAGASEGETGLSAIHAGLSGTGKTTLSNTGFPVADDQICVEIDAGQNVISNMEGGQYAKTDHLDASKEPETWNAILHGTTAENLCILDDGNVDFNNSSITANGRVGYPLEFVPSAKKSAMSGAPANITFLTADGFGVLPPVAQLTTEGGMFHFACGFTSKMPGTEKGIDEPLPTFSSFFGKPFMPLKPMYYMELLAKLIQCHNTKVWLVNTGWLGPNNPNRGRVDILASKAIINAVRDNQIDMNDDNFWYDEIFKLHVPKNVPGVNSELLDPRSAWTDKAAYTATANKLAGIFQQAIVKLQDIPAHIVGAGPEPLE